MKSKTIAVVVTYNPEIYRLECNINNILNEVERIIIIDNNSKNIKSIEQLVNCKFIEKCIIEKNNLNKGIATALNQAIDYANKENFEWLLTLDQDSICKSNIVNIYEEYFNKSLNKSKIAIISPRIVCNDSKNTNKETENPTTVITSGCLTNVKAAINIGKFCDELFIDYVDHEFCLRLRNHGYEILKVNLATILHELGDIKVNSILMFKFVTTNHSPIRRYYYFRNSIYVYRKYLFNNTLWVFRDIIRSVKVIIGIILFENRKKEKLRCIINGLKDAYRGQYGCKF